MESPTCDHLSRNFHSVKSLSEKPRSIRKSPQVRTISINSRFLVIVVLNSESLSHVPTLPSVHEQRSLLANSKMIGTSRNPELPHERANHLPRRPIHGLSQARDIHFSKLGAIENGDKKESPRDRKARSY
jgi:hypothetical protein